MDYFNQPWTEFTGLSFDQNKGWGWLQFIHPEDVEENVRRWQHSIDTGEPFQLEHRFRRADGVYRWHLSRALAMRDAEGRVLMWFGSNTDIDDQKRAAEVFRHAKDAAEAANRAKDEFLANVSHEPAHPGGVARGYSMEPTAAGDGVMAMAVLWRGVAQGRPYPLALLDGRMPDIDGLALAAKIRQHAELAATRLEPADLGRPPRRPEP